MLRPMSDLAGTTGPRPDAAEARDHERPLEGKDGVWSAGRRALTIGLVLNVTIVASEALAVSTIMPIVARDLGGIDLYGWVFSGFFLGSLLGIVVAGVLIDRGSLARPFLLGIGLFAIGLLIGGFAPSMAVLVGARLVQGFGAGAIPTIAYVSIGRALPERLRPRMFATLSTAWVLPGVIGPSLAGLVAETFHWRVVFLGLLPLIAIASILTLPAIAAVGPATDGEGDAERRVAADSRRRLPVAVILVIGAGLAVAGLSNLGPAPPVMILAGVAIAIPAFARLTPAGTLRVRRGMPAAVVLRGVLTFCFFCADAYVPLAIQEWRGAPAIVSGLVFTASTLSWTLGAWVQAHRVARIGPTRFLVAGFTIVTAGIVGFATVLLPSVPLIAGVVTWSITGFGMGLSYSTLSLVVLREAPPAEQGAATAGLQLSDVLGTSLGTGVGGALVALGVRSGSPGWAGIAGAFAVAAAVALAGLALTTRLRASRATTASGTASTAA
jgi:MFS family permease